MTVILLTHHILICTPENHSLLNKLKAQWNPRVAFFCVIQEGVGDTPASFSYDGNRVRKWNVKTEKYGEVCT